MRIGNKFFVSLLAVMLLFVCVSGSVFASENECVVTKNSELKTFEGIYDTEGHIISELHVTYDEEEKYRTEETAEQRNLWSNLFTYS